MKYYLYTLFACLTVVTALTGCQALEERVVQQTNSSATDPISKISPSPSPSASPSVSPLPSQTNPPADTTAPSTPTLLSASAIAPDSATLTWSASTDAVGVAGYRVYNASNNALIANVTTNSTPWTHLSASTSYSFYVTAFDAAGNTSAASVSKSFMTSAIVDTTAPTAPSNLNATAISQNSANLTWTASTDAVGVTGYRVYNAANNAQIAQVASTSTPWSNLTAVTSYSFYVKAYDAAGNVSVASANKSFVTTAIPDTTAPTVPTNLNATGITHNAATLTWTASTDAVGVAYYRVYNVATGGMITQVTTNSATWSVGLTPNTAYSFSVKAYDAAGNVSAASANKSFTTSAAPDTTAPTVPSGLNSPSKTYNTINLAWSASTDTGGSGLAGYRVFRGGTQIAQVTTNSYQAIGLTASTPYAFTVLAYDVAGNISAQSGSFSVTTSAAPGPSPIPSPSTTSSPVAIPAPSTFNPANLPSDATDIKQTLALKVFASNNPDQITVQLQNITSVSRTSAAQVFKKIKGTLDWGASIGTIATSANSLTFAATKGVHYEIKVTATLSSGAGLGYTSAGIEVDAPALRGKTILVIDSTIYPSIGVELTNYKNTLIADGWIPIELQVGRTDSVSSVKSAIQNVYNSDPTNIKSAVLIGRVPVPYSGNGAPDGHGDHYGVWPTDQYYADFGAWPAGSGATTHTGYRLSATVTKFSPNIAPSELEIEIGRIDMNWLDKDLNGAPALPFTELQLIQSYLTRSSDYRKGLVNVGADRAIINNTLYSGAGDNLVMGAFKSFSCHVGVDKIEFTPYGSDYFVSELGPTTKPVAQWVYGGGGSYFGMIGGQIDILKFSAASYNNRGIFFRTFGSYFGDYDTKSNALRFLIAKGYGLTSTYESNPIYTHFMNLGESMGYSVRRSVNSMARQDCSASSTSTGVECISEYRTGAIKSGSTITTSLVYDAAQWGYWGGNYLGITTNLMGDPNLRMSPVKMPSAASSSNGGGTVQFAWTAPSESSIVGYDIYKINYSGATVTGYTKINSALVTSSPYTSSTPYVAGEKFLIKTVKLQTNLSGSLLNHSAGALVTNP